MPLGIRAFDFTDVGIDDEAYWKLENQFDNSSIQFAIEILPVMWSILGEEEKEYTMLDVGARTGAGTHFIAYIHQTHSNPRVKIRATAIDLDAQYLEYSRRNYPFANMKIADIYEMPEDERYDLVLCSHTIEHVPEPARFVARLLEIAKRAVIIACPFEEKEPVLPGHVNVFDREFFEKTEATSLKVYKSVNWHESMACIAVYDKHRAPSNGAPSAGNTGI